MTVFKVSRSALALTGQSRAEVRVIWKWLQKQFVGPSNEIMSEQSGNVFPFKAVTTS